MNSRISNHRRALRLCSSGATAALCVAVMSVTLTYGQESFFPKISGWTMSQEPTVYDSSTLWDIIDGAADLYLQYGFVDLRMARYLNSDGIEIKVELYRHNSNTNAFGIYSQERDTIYNFIIIGVQGYLQKGVLNFLSGIYYVKLMTHRAGEKAQEALVTVGKTVEEHLKQEKSWPNILKMFPMNGKLSNSEQFVARDFLGSNSLNSAYVASYRDGVSFRMFIIDVTTSEQASLMSKKYLRAVPRDSIKESAAGQYEIHSRNGLVRLVITRHFLCGVTDCRDKQTMERHLAELVANLTN